MEALTTRQAILRLSDRLVREKGFNAFSFHDLAREIGIKTASIHYHFPSKTDLGLALVRSHCDGIDALRDKLAALDPLAQLEGFLGIYTKASAENKVCLVGSLATDLNTVDEKIRFELQALAEKILSWVMDILDRGRQEGLFAFAEDIRTKALLITGNMLAILQLSRLTDVSDVEKVRRAIINDLTAIS